MLHRICADRSAPTLNLMTMKNVTREHHRHLLRGLCTWTKFPPDKIIPPLR